MLAVQDMTSNEIHSLQKSLPKIQDPFKSLTRAKGMTTELTSRSETAKDTKKRLESFLRLRSVMTAMQTKRLPKMAVAINDPMKMPKRMCSNMVWTLYEMVGMLQNKKKKKEIDFKFLSEIILALQRENFIYSF